MTEHVTPETIRKAVAGLTAVLQDQKDWHPVTLRSHPRLAGWPAFDLPRRYGGAEWSARSMARLFRLCGRHNAELRDLAGAGHARMLSLISTRRFDAFLRDVAQGHSYCAIAITEPDAGSDLRSVAATAMPVDGRYVIDGVKQHISRISECTHFVVFATVRRGADEPLLTAFLVPRDLPGLTVERMQPSGLSAVTWGRVFLRQVSIPAAFRIGGEGQGHSLFQRHFCYWRTMNAALAIGSAEAAINQTSARMKEREAFGGPIGRFSHLQQALAHWVARLRMCWLLVEDVASEIDAHVWPTTDAAMLKAEALETAIGAVEWATTVFGAAGYDVATGLEKRHRDLLGLRIADGTTDVLRSQVARAFLGERLYEMSLHRRSPDDRHEDIPSRQFW